MRGKAMKQYAKWMMAVGAASALAACLDGPQLEESGATWALQEPATEHPRTGPNVETAIDLVLAKSPTIANLDKVNLGNRYALRAEGDKVIADFFVQAERAEFKGVVKSLEALGGTIHTITSSGVMTVTMELDRVVDAATIPGVGQIELGRRMQKYNDLSHDAEGMNFPNLGTAAQPTGAGVIVGVIDSGLDYYHGDFRNDDGTTRVKAMWDQSDTTSEVPPAGYTYGTAYTEAQLNGCLLVNPGGCDQFDYDGHGTHVTGTAAGNGKATGDFAGGASEADIVFVKFDFDGERNTDTAIIDGVAWIFAQADALGKPAVVNMSLGTDFGPHDGSTLEERGLDDLIDAGRLVVAAAGNAGRTGLAPNNELWGNPMHGAGTFPRNGCSEIAIDLTGATGAGDDYIFFDVWYSGADKLRVQVTTPSGNKYPADFSKRNRTMWTTGSAYTGFNTSEGAILVANGGDQLGWGTNNGDHELYIEISDYYGNEPANGMWTVCLYGTDVVDGTYHSWHGTSGSLSPSTLAYDGTPSDNRVTVGSPATAANVLAIGAYTTRMGWDFHNPLTDTVGCTTYNVGALSYYDAFYLDLDGDGSFDHDFGGDCNFDPGDTAEPYHDLAFFSSRGPTRTGGLKPIVAAPGVGIISALSSTTIAAEVAAGGGYYTDTNRVHADGVHSVLQGTSMATPNATGAIALLLSADGSLTPDDVRALFATSSRADSHTGATPNDDWGHGKLDLAAALAQLICTSDADCDDGNECTTDVCNAASQCENTVLQDGVTCGGGLCCGGACSTPVCAGDADCDDGNECTLDSCSNPGACGASCGSASAADETACGVDGLCCDGSCSEGAISCVCAPVGASCGNSGDDACCSGTCKGKPGAKTCR